jgi:phosphoribosylformylglycinamidine cyclo-ligase
MKKKKITYSQSGVSYSSMDPIKRLAQKASTETAAYLVKSGFQEVKDTKGESAYVWKQGSVYMASVIEGLGTKNLVADAMRAITGKTYYDNIGHDTIAAIINDLATVGAKPLVIHAYWAVGDSKWLDDNERMEDLVKGWKSGCDLAEISWGGGETPTLNGIINPDTIDLGGSAVGIITNEKRLITDKKLKSGDRILMLKSNGINANGISLARAIVKQLPQGYATKLPDGTLYGEALLAKTNIYAKLIQDLLDNNIDIHYISNITGHGLRKVMRAKQEFSYVLEKIFEPQKLFIFIQNQAGLTDKEMYETYNMGMDYAIYLSKQDAEKAQAIIKQNGFESIDAGYIKSGKRQVIIEPKTIVLEGESLQLKA